MRGKRLQDQIDLIGWTPRWLRRHFLRFVDRFLDSDEGRALLANRVRGLLCKVPVLDPEFLRAPYQELSRDPKTEAQSDRAAIFVTARFRSGSTLLWNIFRHLPNITAYYEPLNESRWFALSPEHEQVDSTHKHVSGYTQEYRELKVLGRYYNERWCYRNLYMGPQFWDPDLKKYIEILINSAAGRPVLQFNRVDFRLQWLRRQFPTARIVHLFRHPRDQWISSLYNARMPRDTRMSDFKIYDRFYLIGWARDLKFQFPFLDEAQISHPYALFYFIWKLSFGFGRQFSDYSLAYEDILCSPRDELSRLFSFLQIEEIDWDRLIPIIEAPSGGKWRLYADDGWFRDHEEACEAVLADFFRNDTSLQGQLGSPKRYERAKAGLTGPH